MTYKDILRHKPWLKLVHINNLTKRFQRATQKNVFIVFNLIQKNYELHSLEAYYLSGDSYNTTINQDLLNGFLLHDYKSNNNQIDLEEIISRKMLLEHLYGDETSNNIKREKHLKDSLKSIERALGGKL